MTGTADLNGLLRAALLLVTLAVLAVAVHGLRGIFVRQEWRAGATPAFALVAGASSAVYLLVALLGASGQTVTDAYGNVVSIVPGWAYRLQLVCYVGLILGGVAMTAWRLLRRDTLLSLPPFLVLLLALASGASALLHGDSPVKPFYLVMLAVLAATCVVPRGLGPVVGIGTFCAFATLFAGLTVVVSPEHAIFACGPAKCGLFGFNVRAYYDNENALALFLALALPFVHLAFGRVHGLVIGGYMVLIVLMSGSRTGALAAVVAYAALVVVGPSLRRPRHAPVRSAGLAAVLSVGAVVGLLMPFLVDDPEAFTQRGYLWSLARASLQEPTELLFGSGYLGWQHVRDAGLIDFSAVYSVHNQWLQVFFSAGLLGAFLAGAAFLLLFRQAGRTWFPVLGCVLLPAVVLGITERPWTFEEVNWLAWALPAALVCVPEVRRSARPAGRIAAERPHGESHVSAPVRRVSV